MRADTFVVSKRRNQVILTCFCFVLSTSKINGFLQNSNNFRTITTSKFLSSNQQEWWNEPTSKSRNNNNNQNNYLINNDDDELQSSSSTRSRSRSRRRRRSYDADTGTFLNNNHVSNVIVDYDAPMYRRQAVGNVVRSDDDDGTNNKFKLDHDIIVDDNCYLGKDMLATDCVDFDPLHINNDNNNNNNKQKTDVVTNDDDIDNKIINFCKDLFETADDLSRAIESIKKQKDEENSENNNKNDNELMNLLDGIQKVESNLESIFKRHGINKHGMIGDMFDPTIHHALYEIPADCVSASSLNKSSNTSTTTTTTTATTSSSGQQQIQQSGTIGQVIKTGYTLNNTVIRVAEVAVIK